MTEHTISDETIMKSLRNVIAVFMVFTAVMAVTVGLLAS